MPDSRPYADLPSPPKEGCPAEFRIANGASPDELLERLGCHYDEATRKWSAPRGHIVQTSGLRWHESRSKMGGFGSVSLVLHCFAAKNPQEAIEMIRSALPARFLSEDEREQLEESLGLRSARTVSPDKAYL